MRTISVKLSNTSYKIVIGYRIIERIAHLLKDLNITPSKYDLTIITTKNIKNRCKTTFLKYLKNFKINEILIPEGEKSKNLNTYVNLIKKLNKIEKQGTRTCLIAFGGGVITDITGFVAATYRRGVPYINIPTTLLAQVDSAIGGKTGIDLKTGKNLVGAFYQPKLVINEISFLKTLPQREIKSAMAEIIKYGLVSNSDFLKNIRDNFSKIEKLQPKILESTIYRCCLIKSKIVEKDEFDDVERKAIRAKLNFGHTIGHAIESATKYKIYTHGEAVALGMLSETYLAYLLNLISDETFNNLLQILKMVQLPIKIKKTNLNSIINHLYYDKKFTKEKMRFALPTKKGIKIIENPPIQYIKKAISSFIR